MIKFLRRLFIKDYNNVNNAKVREAHGKLASLVGIVSNIFLFAVKLIIGLLSGSISIIADSINNLSDMASSIISLVCFRLSGKPADGKHPYGHERIEYIAGLIVSIIIIMVGGQLGYQSILKIISAEKTTITTLTLIILVISILIKVWQALFNYKVGKIIDSVSLVATATDSRNDVISTTVILIGAIITFFWPNVSLDGYFGLFVSVFIIISGIKLIKETMDPLIGITPKHDFVKKIVEDIKEYNEMVIGVHDAVCHMYGATKKFMSIHVEVPSDSNILEIHDIIDNMEHMIFEKYGVELVIHMDPIDVNCSLTNHLKEIMVNKLNELDKSLSLHDFRIVKGAMKINVIFDVVLPYNFYMTEMSLKEELLKTLKEHDENYELIINFDNSFIENI